MRAPKGQNFLFQEVWQRRVAAAIGPSQRLLEIGGGPGGLSALLAEQTQRFWVVESDAKLAQGLRERFADRPAITVIEADILTVDLSALAGDEPLRVAGNLPYYITSPILLHLFRHAAAVQDATLMVQREVADRLVAAPGSRAFGLLTATTQLYARAQRLLNLPPGAFRPPPKVHSSLVRLTFAPQAAALGVETGPFLAFLRRAFAHKRKQLAGYLVNPALAGLPAQVRAEELSLEQLARLYRHMPVE